MQNIVIYSTKDKKDFVSILTPLTDVNIRIEKPKELGEYSLLKPSIIIIDEGYNVNDIIMSTKFPCPVLFVGSLPDGVTVRALNYDIIKTPVDLNELVIRVKALLEIMDLKNTLSIAITTDSLTGLHNRNYLQERLESEISRAKRYKTCLSCLLFDIDFFKVVNDMYGYEWGDILLRSLADKLKSFVRKEDILTRYGDEEFLLVLPNTSEEKAFLFAERFRREIEKMEFIPAGEEERHPITISGGISTYPCLENVEEDANTVIRYAEHALYNAKKRGKNKIIQFSQINIEY